MNFKNLAMRKKKRMGKIQLLFECLFNWKQVKQASKESQKNADAIFCQSFGLRKQDPGISNKFLANCILKAYSQSPKPLIIQKDCADAFPVDVKVDRVISKHQAPGKYLDSYEVSRQCFDYCRANNLKTVLIFAHPHHIWRVQKTVEKFGLIGVIGDTAGMPYDPKSIQIWTRTKLFFVPRELLTRLFYLFSNKI